MLAHKKLCQSIFCLCISVALFNNAIAIESTQKIDRSFDSWVDRLKNQAFSKGISEETINNAFFDVQQLPSTNYNITKQVNNYSLLERSISPQQIRFNKQLLNQYRDVLFEIKHLFGVDEEVIISIWSMDKQLSASAQPHSAVNIFSSLSYQQPSNKKLQNELFQALKIIDDGQVSADKLRSDSTGKIGSINFNPTQFRTFAVDYDGDGTTDLWKSHADIFASTANFLASIGWKANQPWGVEVKIPEKLDKKIISMNSQRSLLKWHKLGLRMRDGSDFSHSKHLASLVKLNEASGRHFLVFDNYFALLRWKRSPEFALATGMMIDEIKQHKLTSPLTPFAEVNE